MQKFSKVFLSASIPSPERDKKYYESANVVAIRDAVRSLVATVLPKSDLVWGGHPTITPLVRYSINKMQADAKQKAVMYQSLFFRDQLSSHNSAFENIVFTPKASACEESLKLMRKKMFEENKFNVGVFIGGMEGIYDEFLMFQQIHPKALVLSVPSTGAAAKTIYQKLPLQRNERLTNDYAYSVLFRDLLNQHL